jgi:hypothetical protein
MKVGNYELFQTNDGKGIYINNFLVDDKDRCKEYWEGWEYWINKLKNVEFYDFLKRSELIKEIRNKN